MNKSLTSQSLLVCSWSSGKKLFLKRTICLLFILVQVCFTTAYAQTRNVTGIVKNEKGEPVAGVTVSVKGTTTATSTDAQGRYSIPVSDPNSTLVFSFVGMSPQEAAVKNKNSVDIQLEGEEAKKMSEVIVVGYGTAKKATLTGSVSTVKGREIVQSPATNVSNSLAGRLPGLTAVTGSGEPGYDGSTLRIRGTNTISINNTVNSNGVLVVVDGVAGRSLDRIDPNSIESVTVLKDASAAIYGSQAANGVILITTKRGKTGKPEISVNMNVGYNQPTRLPKMADAATYAIMLNEIAYYRSVPSSEWVSGWDQFKNGSYITTGGSEVKPTYSLQDIQKYADGSDPWKYPNTDWFDATLKPRSAQNSYNVTISGGADALRYFVSLGAKTQEGNYYNSATKYNQYDFRTNLDGKISKNITMAFDVAGRLEDRNYPVRGAGSIFRMVMRGKPTLPAYWPDGTPGPDIEYGDNPVVISTDSTGYDRDKFYALNSNLKLNINIPWIKGLSLSGNAAIDKGFDFRKTWSTPWYLYSWDFQTYDANNKPVLVRGKRGFDDARLNQYSRDEITTTLFGLINYETKIANDHSFKALAGIERRKGDGEYYNAFRRFFASTAVDQLWAGGNSEINNNGSGFVNARMSYFGRMNYGFKERYLAEFVWRYDGSYIFPEDKRFGFFPGVSLGWRVSEENFWKNNIQFMDNFKLRASWGQTGNDRILEWQYLSTYAYGNIIGSPFLPYVTNGSTENQTLYETRTPNPNATWEKANQSNVGFEASLLHSKLFVEADYFNYTRSQILWRRNASIPTTAGFTPPFENIGKVRNRGFDFMATYKDRAGDFYYSVSVNGSKQKNRILFWDEAPGRPAYQQSTGHPIPSNPLDVNSDLYYQAIGVFKDEADIQKYPHRDDAKPGDIIFQDVNNDGKIDGDDRVRSYKNNIPTFTAGLNLSLQYKGFDLSVLLQAATGAVNYINTESGEIGNFLQSFAENRWTPENPSSEHPRTFNRGNEYWVGNGNTYWLRKTNYLRLKNLQFGYSIPQHLTQKLGIQQLRFYVSGYNLLTYSPDYKDFDPEASAGSGQSYPLQRVASGGLTLTF